MQIYIDFNDELNVTIMERYDVYEVYLDDKRRLGEVDLIKLIFE